jgi:hypothetical protein
MMRKDNATLRARLNDAALTRQQADAASDLAALLGEAVTVPTGPDRFGLPGTITFGAPTALAWGKDA